MTPLEYDFLRKSLKERSGLVLSADKQYLVESRLLPIARKSGLANLGELVAALRRGDNECLMTMVVEAMTTNETFFFRDRFRSRISAPPYCRRSSPRAGRRVAFASGRPPPLPGRTPTRSP